MTPWINGGSKAQFPRSAPGYHRALAMAGPGQGRVRVSLDRLPER
jgi:hypothetical protein